MLNGDDFRVRAMAEFTSGNRADLWLDARQHRSGFPIWRPSATSGIAFDLHGLWPSRRVALPLAGAHSVELAMAALLTGQVFGLELDEMLAAAQRPRACRSGWFPLPGPMARCLIDDTYNASAPSMLSALRVCEETEAKRRIAVLGGMRELGAETDAQHRIVGEAAARTADLLYTYGELALKLADPALDAANVDGQPLACNHSGKTSARS